MNPEQPVERMATYATQAAYKGQPDAAAYQNGVIPLDTLPAQWWNWLWNRITLNEGQTSVYLTALHNELIHLLEGAGLTPFAGNSSQILGAVKGLITKDVTAEKDRIDQALNDHAHTIANYFNDRPTKLGHVRSATFADPAHDIYAPVDTDTGLIGIPPAVVSHMSTIATNTMLGHVKGATNNDTSKAPIDANGKIGIPADVSTHMSTIATNTMLGHVKGTTSSETSDYCTITSDGLIRIPPSAAVTQIAYTSKTSVTTATRKQYLGTIYSACAYGSVDSAAAPYWPYETNSTAEGFLSVPIPGQASIGDSRNNVGSGLVCTAPILVANRIQNWSCPELFELEWVPHGERPPNIQMFLTLDSAFRTASAYLSQTWGVTLTNGRIFNQNLADGDGRYHTSCEAETHNGVIITIELQKLAHSYNQTCRVVVDGRNVSTSARGYLSCSLSLGWSSQCVTPTNDYIRLQIRNNTVALTRDYTCTGGDNPIPIAPHIFAAEFPDVQSGIVGTAFSDQDIVTLCDNYVGRNTGQHINARHAYISTNATDGEFVLHA